MFSSFLTANGLDILFFAINLAVFIGGLIFLYRLEKRHVKFGNRVFVGLGLGIVLGLLLQIIYGGTTPLVKLTLSWINLVGSIYIGLLRMVVYPLILVSLLTAIVRLKGKRNIGSIGGSVIGILLVTTVMAGLVGALLSVSFGLTSAGLDKGKAETDRQASLEKSVANVSNDLPYQIASFIPGNPFQDLTGARSTSTIAVVIFAGFLGFAFLSVAKKHPDQFASLSSGVEALNTAVGELVKIVIRLTPYGVVSFLTNIVAASDWAQILKLINFVLVSYLAILIVFGIHALILLGIGLNPLTYFKKAWSTLSFAFISRSSASTLPLTIKTQTTQLGVPEAIADIGSSLALSIGQNGCAGIYPAMLAVMVAPTVGINPLAPDFLIKLLIIVAISSFGIAGVGGGATYAGLVVLSSLGLPVWIAALLISVEPLIDMARTALNVSDAFVANLVTAKLRGELNANVYNDQLPELVEEAA